MGWKRERAANMFTAAGLMPRGEVLRLHNLEAHASGFDFWDGLSLLSSNFNVSNEAMAWRLWELDRMQDCQLRLVIERTEEEIRKRRARAAQGA